MSVRVEERRLVLSHQTNEEKKRNILLILQKRADAKERFAIYAHLVMRENFH